VANPNDFLSNLGNILDSQFSTGDSKNKSLDIAQYGYTNQYSNLSAFANQSDQTAERSYTEEGAQRIDYNNYTPKQLNISMQDPNATVLVKKRMFSSLAENYRPDYMDAHEQLFYRATKVLFQNKCTQISSYEKLCKIAQVSSDIGRVDYHLLPIIFSLTDNIAQTPSATLAAYGADSVQDSVTGALSKFTNIIDRVKEIYALSQDTPYTSWIAGIPDTFRSSFSQGTGVIEFTNVTQITTTTKLDFAGGTFTLNFNDPYKIMRITNLDIEQAINDATNKFYSNSFSQFGVTSLDQTITLQKQQLNMLRQLRGADPINFFVSTNAYSGKIVQAVIDNLGFEINYDVSTLTIDPSALQGSDAVGNDGLGLTEVVLFGTIINALYSQLTMTANTRRNAIANNQDQKKNLNLIRKKMRLNYAGKLVIQPMDTVHIYMNSKKKIDNKILGGLQSSFSGLGFLQGLNNLTNDIKDTFAINENYSLEKSVFVGNDFPNWLWQIMRGQIVSDKDGTHVFAGIVESAASSYSDRKYTVSVSGSDNAGYFKYGVVNFKPSVEVFNGSLFDPMTPFKLEFDTVTGVQDNQLELLDENKQLFNSEFVKDKNGLFAGTVSTETNFLQQDADRVKNNSVRRVFYDPDGMVYRWKEGIATLALFGDTYQPSPPGSYAPAIISDPFAGQDIMNVISLLISGQPYNFTTFYKAALMIDGSFKKDSGTNRDSSGSFLRGLTQQLKERNAIYGNFIPFKQLTVDETTFSKVLNNQINATSYDADLQSLLKQRADFADKLSVFGITNAQDLATKGNSNDKLLQQNLQQLDTLIQKKINDISQTLNQAGNPPVSLLGNDISFDYDNSNLNSGSSTRLDDSSRRDLRRRLAFLTRRIAWKVRANEDINFFIVDDTYDKDYDIQAFITEFVNPETFKSDYMTVATKIENIKNVIAGFELFVNTQGHIEARSPRYNRVPSSVFYKMLRLKDDLGIQIFPQFLEDLSLDQLDAAYQNIETLEDEIRLYCLALGYATDDDCESFINSFDQGTLAGIQRVSGNIGGFQFVSDEQTGKITNTVSLNVLSQPDAMNSAISASLDTNNLQQQTNLNLFNVASRAEFVQSVLPSNTTNNTTQFQTAAQIASDTSAQTRQSMIVTRLQGATSMMFDLSQLFPNGSQQPSVVSSNDILQIANGISGRLSQRQTAIKTAVNSLKSLQEGLTLVSGSGGPGNQALGNALLHPSLSRSKNIPKTFEYMIEDESYDDYGPGSGNRYVIKNNDIINYSITENRPQYTSIEVTGRFGGQAAQLINQNGIASEDLKLFQYGNAFNSVSAVDYDLWRMYGISVPQGIDAPYLTNPEVQCAPYAVSVLNQARKEILKASLTIVGNEYQQPGEVLYLEDIDLLFYVHSVQHNFTYGQGFTTTLELTHGHNLGEYIPTFLDVIGKMFYKNNKDTTNLAHKRQGNVFNQEHVATIVGNTATSNSVNGIVSASNTSSIDDDITNAIYGSSNKMGLQRLLDYGGSTLSLDGAVLELRIYSNSNSDNFSDPNTYALKLANEVLGYLTGSTDLTTNAQPTGSLQTNPQKLSAYKEQIQVTIVDSYEDGEFRAPSREAFYYGRDIANKNSSGSGDATLDQYDIDNAIYSYIVDCWIVFNNPADSTNPADGT
jgi:hypothetical protein